MKVTLTKNTTHKKDGKKYTYWRFELGDGTVEHAGTTENLFRLFKVGKGFDTAKKMKLVRGINKTLPENTNYTHELIDGDI